MTLRFSSIFACLTAGMALLCISTPLTAQTSGSDLILEPVKVAVVADSDLPDAPMPQQAPAATPDPGQQPASSAASSASGQQAAPDAAKQAADDNAPRQKTAAEQLKDQEHQRVLGIVPNFNTSYVYGAASLSAKQKFELAFRSQIDPVAFGVAGFVALIGQAEPSHPGYGGGWGGYAKRYGQTYTDSFDGQMIGNALLPSILHQDPRYFRLGRGSTKRRILYALGTNVITRHDVTGKWEPNYSNIMGNFISGAISNAYIPEQDRGFSSTITGGLTVLVEGGAGSMFQEFWPDICRHFLHKDPTHGQDAINKMKPDPTGSGNPFSNHPKIEQQ
jgi:hypothetical protein